MISRRYLAMGSIGLGQQDSVSTASGALVKDDDAAQIQGDGSRGRISFEGRAILISSWIKANRSWGAVPVAVPMTTLAVIVAAGLLYAGYPEAAPLGVMFLGSAV